LKEARLLKESDCSPVRSFTTPWLLCDGAFFYVHVAIVGPVTEQPQGYLSLSSAEVQDILETIADSVISLEKKALGEDSV